MLTGPNSITPDTDFSFARPPYIHQRTHRAPKVAQNRSIHPTFRFPGDRNAWTGLVPITCFYKHIAITASFASGQRHQKNKEA